MKRIFKVLAYFRAAIVLAVLGIALGAMVGWFSGGMQGAVTAALSTFILGVLETTLSLDNSIVDAGILKQMDRKWQKRYIWFGMPISVFGMRLLFPILIVSAVAQLSPWSTFILALEQPQEYGRILTSSHALITAFGGAFLLLISFNYFFDDDKEHHWLKLFEHPMSKLGAVKGISVALTLAVIVIMSRFIGAEERVAFLTAGALGIIGYVMVKDGLGALTGKGAAPTAVRSGIASFIYLEFIDASMSFDGVIGAFAITTNILIIAIGLGIGAMFVRSLTLLMLEENVIGELCFLENGAYFAILSLACLMFLNLVFEIPDIVTGLVGALFISMAAFSSILEKKKLPSIE